MSEERYIVKFGDAIVKYGDSSILRGLEIDHIVPIPDQVAYWAFDNDLTDSVGSYDFNVAAYPPWSSSSSPPPWQSEPGGDAGYAEGPSIDKSYKMQGYVLMNQGSIYKYKILESPYVIQDIIDSTADASVSVSFWLYKDASAYGLDQGVLNLNGGVILASPGYSNQGQGLDPNFMYITGEYKINEFPATAHFNLYSSYGDGGDLAVDMGDNSTNKWHHIVISRSNDFGHFYVDGSLRHSQASPPNLPDFSTTNHWGKRTGFQIMGALQELYHPTYDRWGVNDSATKNRIYDSGPKPLPNGYWRFASMRVFERQITQEEVDLLYFNKI